jgi:hypothetical protein
LINWTYENEGNNIVTDVALGDFDIAFKLENKEPRQTPFAIGNVMWRSPEGQTGRGVTKASDIFSFGLVVSKPVLTQGCMLSPTCSAYMLWVVGTSCF